MPYAGDIVKLLPGNELDNSWAVDGYVYGDCDYAVTGILCVFIADYSSFCFAAEHGINMIISHEGVFFDHLSQRADDAGWKKNDRVYTKKAELIKNNDFIVYRYHDAMHAVYPDPVTESFLSAVKLDPYKVIREKTFSVIDFSPMPLSDILKKIKMNAGLSYVRYVGEPLGICSRALVAVGYRGAGAHILPLVQKYDVDLIIYGEGPEWEVPEYVSDSRYSKKPLSLIVTGHRESETAGMKFISRYLGEIVGVPVLFFDSGSLFSLFS